MNENIILDFETTVADLGQCFEKAFSETFAQFGIPYDSSHLEEYMSMPLNKVFEEQYKGCTCKYRDFVTKFIGSFDRSFQLAEERPGAEELLGVMEGHATLMSRTFDVYVRRFLGEHDLPQDVRIMGRETSEDLAELIRTSCCRTVVTRDPVLMRSNVPDVVFITPDKYLSDLNIR